MDGSAVGVGGAAAAGVKVGESEGVAVLVAVARGVGGGDIVAGEAAGGGLGGAGGLVHEGGQHDAAGAVPVEGVIELVVLPAGGSHGMGFGAVDLEMGADVFDGGIADGGSVGVAEEDGELLVVG